MTTQSRAHNAMQCRIVMYKDPKVRFEPATLYSTHKSPNHYTTAVVAAAITLPLS